MSCFFGMCRMSVFLWVMVFALLIVMFVAMLRMERIIAMGMERTHGLMKLSNQLMDVLQDGREPSIPIADDCSSSSSNEEEEAAADRLFSFSHNPAAGARQCTWVCVGDQCVFVRGYGGGVEDDQVVEEEGDDVIEEEEEEDLLAGEMIVEEEEAKEWEQQQVIVTDVIDTENAVPDTAAAAEAVVAAPKKRRAPRKPKEVVATTTAVEAEE